MTVTSEESYQVIWNQIGLLRNNFYEKFDAFLEKYSLGNRDSVLVWEIMRERFSQKYTVAMATYEAAKAEHEATHRAAMAAHDEFGKRCQTCSYMIECKWAVTAFRDAFKACDQTALSNQLHIERMKRFNN